MAERFVATRQSFDGVSEKLRELRNEIEASLSFHLPLDAATSALNTRREKTSTTTSHGCLRIHR